MSAAVHTIAGGSGHPRQVELLPNGLWRVDWRGGLVSLYEHDPRPAFASGYEPPERAPSLPPHNTTTPRRRST